MRIIPTGLLDTVREIEKITKLNLVQGFSALFMATDKSVEEIFSMLISDLEPQTYIEFGFLISDFLNCPRELILRDRKKVKDYLDQKKLGGFKKTNHYVSKSQYMRVQKEGLDSKTLNIPTFAKKGRA